MGKFNKAGAAQATPQQVGTSTGLMRNHAGGWGHGRDARRDLMLLAAVNMVGEDTFYEAASVRDARYRDLVHQVAVEDYGWMHAFIMWLRDGANMRSASIVAACEAVKARLDAKQVPAGRTLIDVACQRADEPGELLAYWHSRYGKKVPIAVKRGLGDAARRLYNERNALKYDSREKAVRMADVLELAHPSPAPNKPWQGDLFKYLIDDRHNRAPASPPKLQLITRRNLLMAVPVEQRRAILLAEDGPRHLDEAGVTWEALSGWLQGPMDKAAWEAIIPSMQAMALVRNLRNFDEAGVSDEVATKYVIPKLMDEESIRRSKMFPYRMLSAEKTVHSRRWSHALDVALKHSCKNIPKLTGRTLVLVDTSGSMQAAISARSQVRHVDAGALFGVALAVGGNDVDLYGFANGVFEHKIDKRGSVLGQTVKFTNRIGEVGHGTEAIQSVLTILANKGRNFYKRIVLISDMQAFRYGGGYHSSYMSGSGLYMPAPKSVSEAVPSDVALFGVCTTGYASSQIDLSTPNRYEIGGFSDSMFKLVALLSDNKDAGWPWD